ncbi:MAG: hypothetical protein K1X29_06995 [Bdellovibrionales bacterium]|nr:hypothetical protein [Bdellovibrionales bacterium]
MKNSDSPWKHGALFICEKCGKRQDADPILMNFAIEVKEEFKLRLKSESIGKSVRVATSSCLSLCPPNKQVAAWCPSEGKMEMIELKASEKETLFSWLKKKIANL